MQARASNKMACCPLTLALQCVLCFEALVAVQFSSLLFCSVSRSEDCRVDSFSQLDRSSAAKHFSLSTYHSLFARVAPKNIYTTIQLQIQT